MFVCYFGQWVGLVYELRQLRRVKEFMYCSCCWFCVDKVLWYYSVDFDRGYMFFNCVFYVQQIYVVLVFYQFVNGMYMMVVEVVDVVYVVMVVMQFDQSFDVGYDVFFVQGVYGVFGIQSQMYVYFYMVNCGQIIVFVVKEQCVKQCRGCFDGGWFIWMYYVVDIYECGFVVYVFVLCYGIVYVWIYVDVVDV